MLLIHKTLATDLWQIFDTSDLHKHDKSLENSTHSIEEKKKKGPKNRKTSAKVGRFNVFDIINMNELSMLKIDSKAIDLFGITNKAYGGNGLITGVHLVGQ